MSFIHQIKISLKNCSPPIWRRLLIHPDITFHQLHRIIQISMEWDDYHLHQFACRITDKEKAQAEEMVKSKLGDLFNVPALHSLTSILSVQEKAYIGDPDQLDDFRPHIFFDEHEEKVSDWLEKEKDKCLYTYDFGDDWEHEILLEKIVPANPEIRYPLCIKAKREAPGEDSGGFWGDEVNEGRTDREIVDDINIQFQSKQIQLNPEEQTALNANDRVESVVSMDNWNKLYQAAIRFKELKSWDWMDSDTIFAVEDKGTGYTGYCCVMGAGGELFGLAVYVGNRGLNTLIKVLAEDVGKDDLLNQRSLLLTFENREELDSEDYEVIRALGLRFRGRNQWPVFRSYAPGLYPWYLDKQEVLFMTHVLEQAVDVCRIVREDPGYLQGKKQEDILTRRSIPGEHRMRWEDVWLKLEPVPEADAPPILLVHELQLQRVKSYQTKKVALGFEFRYLPEPVQEQAGDRPNYPYAGLWFDLGSGLILDAEIVHKDDHVRRFQEKLLELVQKNGWKPETILVQKEDVYNVLFPIAEKLDIQLALDSELEAMDHVFEEMFHSIRFHR